MKNTNKTINFKKVLKNLMTDEDAREPIFKLNEKGEYVFDKEVPITLEKACLTALSHKDEGFDKLGHDVIDKRYSVIKKVKAHEDLNTEEKAVVIILSRKALPVQLSGQVIEILG